MSACGTIPAIAGLDAPDAPATPYEFRAIPNELRDGYHPARQDALQAGAARQEALERTRREAFVHGRLEGERAARAAMEARFASDLEGERERISDALKDFREKRTRYFADSEQEVVRLALAIAARVLHREVQLDPLLLTGVARVALGQLADRSGVVLGVPEADVAAWQDAFAGMEPADRPTIAGTASLARGECAIETSVGSVELGITAQLEEIERGFFDLLSHRPS